MRNDLQPTGRLARKTQDGGHHDGHQRGGLREAVDRRGTSSSETRRKRIAGFNHSFTCRNSFRLIVTDLFLNSGRAAKQLEAPE